jgi:hypothetical protein
MSILFLIRVGNTLHGLGDESVCELLKLPMNKPLRCEVKMPRNPRFHALYFALCARIANGIGSDAETISTVFKYSTGHYDIIRSKKHGELKVPKSISFAKMDNTVFREFFDKCLVAAFSEWGLDASAFADLLDQRTEKRG